MASKDYLLTIEAGTDFARTFVLRRKDANGNYTIIPDLTGVGYAEVRTAPGAKLLMAFAVSIDQTVGSVTIKAPRTATRHRGKGVWDLRIVNGPQEYVWLRGGVTFQPQVTVTP